jgi:hypothetical protein
MQRKFVMVRYSAERIGLNWWKQLNNQKEVFITSSGRMSKYGYNNRQMMTDYPSWRVLSVMTIWDILMWHDHKWSMYVNDAINDGSKVIYTTYTMEKRHQY